MRLILLLLISTLFCSCASIRNAQQKQTDDYTVAKMVYESVECPKHTIHIKHQYTNSRGITVYTVSTCWNDVYVHKTNNSFKIVR